MSMSGGARYQHTERKKFSVQNEVHLNRTAKRDYQDEGDTYETYSEGYYEEFDAQERSRRSSRNEPEKQPAKNRYHNQYDRGSPRVGRHVHRIEITNGEENRTGARVLEKHCREQSMNMQGEEHRGLPGRDVVDSKSMKCIPPAPPAPSTRVTGFKVHPNQLTLRSVKPEWPKRRNEEPGKPSRTVQPHKVGLQEETPQEEHPVQAERTRLSGQMVVVNMGRAPHGISEQRTGSRAGSNGRVSTNPFSNAAQMGPLANTSLPQQVKNVQDAVQRMNNGDWPIKIEEEEANRKPNQGRSEQSQEIQRQQEKAHNWETLPKNKNISEANGAAQLEDVTKHQRRGFTQVGENEQFKQRNNEHDYRSDSSEFCEQTTMSTDSAFSSETAASVSQLGPFLNREEHAGRGRKLLEREARKLLLYFKSNRLLLNYLGIGLTEALWHHISALPLCHVQITVIEDVSQSHDNTNGEVNILVPVATHPPWKSVSSNKARKIDRLAPAQQPRYKRNVSVGRRTRLLLAGHAAKNAVITARTPLRKSPRLVALERQLRTDDLDKNWDDASREYSSDGESDRREGRKADSGWNVFAKGGRFVKKSAAALIAKKQGHVYQNGEEEPNSSEIVDPRIANEIRALREREEELRQSRTELGLPTIDDVMSKLDYRSFGEQNGLRSARSYDQLHQLTNGMFCQSQSEHLQQLQMPSKDSGQFVKSPMTQNSGNAINKRSSRTQHDPNKMSNNEKPRSRNRTQAARYSSQMDL